MQVWTVTDGSPGYGYGFRGHVHQKGGKEGPS
jgi:hypothetical protein